MLDVYVQLACAVAAFGLAVYLWDTGAGIYAVLAPFCFALSIGVFNIWTLVPEEHQWAAWAAGFHFMVVVYIAIMSAATLRPPSRDSLIAPLLWGVLFLAEGYTLFFENLLCNFALEDPGEGHIYVCGRVIHEEFTTLPLVILTGLLVWIGLKWQHPRLRR